MSIASRRMLRTATRPPRRAWRPACQVAAALLGQLRDDQPDDLAVVAGRQAQVGLQDGLLDGADGAAIPGPDHEQARLGHGDAGQLVQGCGGAVVVDLQALDQRGRGPAGADAPQVVCSASTALSIRSRASCITSLIMRHSFRSGSGLPVAG